VTRKNTKFLLVLLAFGGIIGGGYVLFSGWPHDRPPPIAQGVIVEADWADFDAGSRKFNAAIQQKFPQGAPESKLVQTLVSQHFHFARPAHEGCKTIQEQRKMEMGSNIGGGPTSYYECPEWDPKRTLRYAWGGIPCDQYVLVQWSADKQGRLTHIQGFYGGGCM
jgi:hypothetical protein